MIKMEDPEKTKEVLERLKKHMGMDMVNDHLVKIANHAEARRAFMERINKIGIEIESLFKEPFLTVPDTKDLALLEKWAEDLARDKSVNNYERGGDTIASTLLNLRDSIVLKVQMIENITKAIWYVAKKGGRAPFDKEQPMPSPHGMFSPFMKIKG
jgi:hypothetical protein